MPSQRHNNRLQRVLIPLLILVGVAQAGKPSGTWAPAHCKSCEEGGTPAKQATCPASNPISCSAISQDDYCCPSDNYCMWANSQVVCCPEGCDCNEGSSSSWVASTSTWEAQSTWAPAASSSWHATSTWHSSYHATTYASTITSSAVTSADTTAAGSTTTSCDECEWRPTDWNGVYCSTIFAHGANLPTTARAACGVVLVKESSDTVRILISWTKMVAMVVGLQALGGFFLVWR